MTSATCAQDFSDHTYVLPLRRSTLVTDDEDLTSYLRWLAQHMDVIIVDGSPAEIYAHHEVLWGHLVRHIPVTSSSPNGKVAGVCDGVHAASTPFVIIADDDVRYHEDALSAVSALLACHEAVVPQNYFHPTPWHARWDTGRSLLNRCFGADFAGTITVSRAAFLASRGYCGAVLFENLELIRTIEAAGFSVCKAREVYVPRRPPTTRQFLNQRLRQAYDSRAQPRRLVVELSVLPSLTVINRSPRTLAAFVGLIVVLAEIGRRRSRGGAIWPPSSAFWAPAWVLERSAAAWIVMLLARRGGVRYHGRKLKIAAHGHRQLVDGDCPEASCVCHLPMRPTHTAHQSQPRQPELIDCPGGPLLVRGALAFRDATNDVHAITRPVAAICRCSKSSRAPWCDGTHKLLDAKRVDDPTTFSVRGDVVCQHAGRGEP
jgi:CDGSH-type Zn-finger protein